MSYFMLVLLVTVVGGFGVITLLTVAVDRAAGSGAEKRLLDKTDPEASVRGMCYMGEGFLEEPCAAQVFRGELSIFTRTGKELRIPLSDLRLTRIKRNNITGRYPWFLKTVFSLESPQTQGFRLGVKAAEADQWEHALHAA